MLHRVSNGSCVTVAGLLAGGPHDPVHMPRTLSGRYIRSPALLRESATAYNGFSSPLGSAFRTFVFRTFVHRAAEQGGAANAIRDVPGAGRRISAASWRFDAGSIAGLKGTSGKSLAVNPRAVCNVESG